MSVDFHAFKQLDFNEKNKKLKIPNNARHNCRTLSNFAAFSFINEQFLKVK